ncbi:uncharacterized protein LOC106169765 isoform X3 [Lingula anatina]|uniref:Uncharacterized protein LOC106169765 isoform X1 n=1 Tax=Lingula anatina TaxID=7574 RepID=A0A1S3J3I1_LINAN|nr:uncharacterized protein LOC106169765 isoform X1 [Lingula anatina]XP_013404829.1 uncharacterized protein LOC106169765 isoform X3 [Lingula anatina]|eukprot:XP_013404826.1 uncharacterized protein LOC106169765 isoform X1 [Lingula anatina]
MLRKLIVFSLLVAGGFAALNLDKARDEMVARVSKLRRRRSVTNIDSVGLRGAANRFAGALGMDLSSSPNYRPAVVAGTSWADACIYGSNPRPWPYPRPYPRPYPTLVLPTIRPPFPWDPRMRMLGSGGPSVLSGPIGALSKREIKPKRKINRDIVFVLDTSGSISTEAFERAKEGVAILTSSFCPTTMGSGQDGEKQIALVLFGDEVETAIPFTESHAGVDQLNRKIIALRHRQGSATATAEALRHTRTNVLGKGVSRLNNPDTATHVFVITDGRCNRGCSQLAEEADKLRAMKGVQLFAMGIDNARACELEIITGQGSDLAYGLNDFNQFEQFAQAVQEKASQEPNKCV